MRGDRREVGRAAEAFVPSHYGIPAPSPFSNATFNPFRLGVVWPDSWDGPAWPSVRIGNGWGWSRGLSLILRVKDIESVSISSARVTPT